MYRLVTKPVIIINWSVQESYNLNPVCETRTHFFWIWKQLNTCFQRSLSKLYKRFQESNTSCSKKFSLWINISAMFYRYSLKVSLLLQVILIHTAIISLAVLKIKIFLVMVNWSLSRRSTYLLCWSQDYCFVLACFL